MARYFCHFSRNGIRFDDSHGFLADDHDEALDIAKGIGAVILHNDPKAGDAMLELYSDGGDLVVASSLSGLLTDLQ